MAFCPLTVTLTSAPSPPQCQQHPRCSFVSQFLPVGAASIQLLSTLGGFHLGKILQAEAGNLSCEKCKLLGSLASTTESLSFILWQETSFSLRGAHTSVCVCTCVGCSHPLPPAAPPVPADPKPQTASVLGPGGTGPEPPPLRGLHPELGTASPGRGPSPRGALRRRAPAEARRGEAGPVRAAPSAPRPAAAGVAPRAAIVGCRPGLRGGAAAAGKMASRSLRLLLLGCLGVLCCKSPPPPPSSGDALSCLSVCPSVGPAACPRCCLEKRCGARAW